MPPTLHGHLSTCHACLPAYPGQPGQWLAGVRRQVQEGAAGDDENHGTATSPTASSLCNHWSTTGLLASARSTLSLTLDHRHFVKSPGMTSRHQPSDISHQSQGLPRGSRPTAHGSPHAATSHMTTHLYLVAAVRDALPPAPS
ncbi:hypothetical protein N8I77_008620 [Diaporthe amygdali]|uniref:Uncharacterized protein n=1 Tax=Phomopsis amygdali TaxID=1214568 RepID=A0AAD9S860_PHOAM|nr:hypothetical protein N8I77_008620 [Diaporthe amygdali]